MKKKPVSVDFVTGPFNSAGKYVKELMASGPDGIAGKGLELGVGAILAKTALKRLPPPLNIVAPVIVEKVILTHGVDAGRDALIAGLKWIKRVTDEKEPVKPEV